MAAIREQLKRALLIKYQHHRIMENRAILLEFVTVIDTEHV